MPIKWNITAKAMKARSIMDQISTAYDGVLENGAEHLADVAGLAEQIGEMQDDLQAAANVMGNSGGASNEQPKPVVAQTAPPAIQQPDPPAIAPPVITAPAGFDMRPGAVNRIDGPGQGVQIVGDQRHFDRMGG